MLSVCVNEDQKKIVTKAYKNERTAGKMGERKKSKAMLISKSIVLKKENRSIQFEHSYEAAFFRDQILEPSSEES